MDKLFTPYIDSSLDRVLRKVRDKTESTGSGKSGSRNSRPVPRMAYPANLAGASLILSNFP